MSCDWSGGFASGLTLSPGCLHAEVQQVQTLLSLSQIIARLAPKQNTLTKFSRN